MVDNKTDSNLYAEYARQAAKALPAGALGSWRLTRVNVGLRFTPGESFLTVTGLTTSDIPENFEDFIQKFITDKDRKIFRSTLTSLFDNKISDNEFSIDHHMELSECAVRFRSFGVRHFISENDIVVSGFSQKLTGMKDRFGLDEDCPRMMLDSIPLACIAFDGNYQIIDCNQAAADLFELPDKQAYADNFFRLSPGYQPNGRTSTELVYEYMGRAFESGCFSFEWMHHKLNGTPIPCNVTLVRVLTRGGFIVVGYIQDIRELKDAQAERDTERQLLRRILDSAPICFFISVGGVIRFLTNFARNFTGRIEGEDLSDIFEIREIFNDLSGELDGGGFINWRQVNIIGRDGQVHVMLLNAFQSDYYGERGFMAWLMDVTELKNRAQELKEARDAAEDSAKAKSEFLANMSHEIRTPMNAVLGLIHLVMQTDLSDLQREYLQKTESSAKTLLRIINDILDFSKIEAGKLEMEREPFLLDDAIQQVIDVISPRATEKNLELLVRVPADAPAQLVGDQVRLAQVLSNLLNNAVKFTEKGEVSLTVETVQENDREVILKFVVHDTGIGLSPDQVGGIFRAFSQAELSTTRRYGGTGLGLTISKRLVQMMGGDIWCESCLNQGSAFGFTSVFGSHGGERRYVTRRKDFSGLKALTVDDNAVALDIVSDFLRTLGFSVSAADSGSKALEIIGQQSGRGFDLVLIDWKMPGMDGIETSSRISRMISPDELPVIIMATAYNRDEVLEQARRNGITNVMTKPLSPSTMLNMLVDIFGRGLPQRAIKLNKTYEMAAVKEFAGARILLAEDNEVNQLVASRILKNAGLEVDIASNGRQAVDMVAGGNYDLALMDIQMPEMDGMEATRAIRAMPGFALLPIVAMTAHAMSGDRELSLKAGMNDHINKPINLQELFSVLARWLKKKD